MKNRSVLLAAAISLLTLVGCDRHVPTAPAATPPPQHIAFDGEAGDCFSHEIVWDWSLGAWRDNDAMPPRYYDQDPYYNCPNASEGRAPDWGNEWGDGGGYLYWDYLARISPDVFEVVERETALCPVCRVVEVATKVAEDPAVQEEAAAIMESVGGLATRAVLAYNQYGPRIASQIHHIMTDKNWRAAPQWSAQFSNLLARVGMTLNDINNRVSVQGHLGKHPQPYHEYIWDRVFELINGGGTRPAVEELLRELGRECATTGTYCNRLITGQW